MERNSLKSGGHIIDIVFTLALLFVFAASALLVVLIGANVYKSTASSMNENFDMRTSITYISTKMHQNDTAGGVFVAKLDDVDALVLEQSFDEQVYQTWIYHYNGELREIFTEKGNTMHVSDGQAIMSVPVLKIEQTDDGMLKFTAVDSGGNQTSLVMSTRCK